MALLARGKDSLEQTRMEIEHGTMAALKRMLPRDRGTVVQVGSALAYRSIPLQSAYCGAKAAIRGFTDSVRCELLHEKSQVHITMVQMPALNTPQFEWTKSRMPNKSQPVPPIFQPEVAARAILWATDHRDREINVGWSTVKAIVFGAKAPGLGDRVLANMGYSAQQTAEARDPATPNNLFDPVAGDHGAHGAFDAREIMLGRSLGAYASHRHRSCRRDNRGWCRRVGASAQALSVIVRLPQAFFDP